MHTFFLNINRYQDQFKSGNSKIYFKSYLQNAHVICLYSYCHFYINRFFDQGRGENTHQKVTLGCSRHQSVHLLSHVCTIQLKEGNLNSTKFGVRTVAFIRELSTDSIFHVTDIVSLVADITSMYGIPRAKNHDFFLLKVDGSTQLHVVKIAIVAGC